jgi:hypothetical protein
MAKRKTAKELCKSWPPNEAGRDEAHEWLASANLEEIHDFLQINYSEANPWNRHGKVALEVAIAKENLKKSGNTVFWAKIAALAAVAAALFALISILLNLFSK